MTAYEKAVLWSNVEVICSQSLRNAKRKQDLKELDGEIDKLCAIREKLKGRNNETARCANAIPH